MNKNEIIIYINAIKKYSLENGDSEQRSYFSKELTKEFIKNKVYYHYVKKYHTKKMLLDYLTSCINASYTVYKTCI